MPTHSFPVILEVYALQFMLLQLGAQSHVGDILLKLTAKAVFPNRDAATPKVCVNNGQTDRSQRGFAPSTVINMSLKAYTSIEPLFRESSLIHFQPAAGFVRCPTWEHHLLLLRCRFLLRRSCGGIHRRGNGRCLRAVVFAPRY